MLPTAAHQPSSTSPADRPGRLPHWQVSVRAALREHLPFLGGIAAYWLIALMAGVSAVAVPTRALALAVLVWLALVAVHLLVTVLERPGRTPIQPWVNLSAWLRRRARDPGEALRILLAVCGIGFLMLTFGEFKPLLPDLGTYRWDGLFATLDHALHGGVDPWVLTRAIPGGQTVSALLDHTYLLWYPALAVGHLAAILFARPVVRMQYLLSVLLMWSVAGTGLAILFASGGPVYFHALTGEPGTFAPLIDDLLRSHLAAPVLQAQLWDLHVAGNPVAFSGISAMPSVHVGIAALIAFLALRLHPVLGIVGEAYWLLIMVGSVHLGWHYAVDGYFATLFAAGSWWVTGRLARWWLRSGPPHGQVGDGMASR